MSAVEKSAFEQALLINLGSPSSSKVLPGPKLGSKMKLSRVRFVNLGAIAADPTVIAVVTLKSGSTELAVFSSEDDGFASGTWLDAEIEALNLSANSQLTVDVALTGDPEALPDPIPAPALTQAAIELILSPV